MPSISRDREKGLKTKDKSRREGRSKSGGYLSGRKLTAKFRKELARRGRDGPETVEAQTAEQTVQVAGDSLQTTARAARDTAARMGAAVQRRKVKTKEARQRRTQGQGETVQEGRLAPEGNRAPAQAPPTLEARMKQKAVQEKQAAARTPAQVQAGLVTAQPSPPPASPVPPHTPTVPHSLHGDLSLHPSIYPAPASGGGRALPSVRDRAPTRGIKGRPAHPIRTRQAMEQGASGGKNAARAHKAARGRGILSQAQERMKEAAQGKLRAQAGQAARTAASLGRKAVMAVTRAAAALVSALVGLAGGAVLLVAVCAVILVAAVVLSPFGIFFADQGGGDGTVSPNGAIAQINVEYAAKLEELQAGDYDSVELHGQPPDWKEVLAVFACKTAAGEDGVDVATLDPDRVDRLRAAFWDMTILTTEVEAIHHPGNGEEDDGWTEHILHITIKARTPDDMRVYYQFTSYQNEALDALLEELDSLGGLLGDLSITQADAVALLQSLPEDLDPERRAVIQHALSLVGKLNYFWGGKSLVLGWDDRWGTTMEVTAAGSSTTGTFRPYGMDCSGFVDWVFYNATGGDYIIGHGGGAHAQHTYCDPISWDEALPGDLVFYPDDEHVGIVGGRDENGELLIIHCAFSQNNVVITGASGFTSIGRPVYFSE